LHSTEKNRVLLINPFVGDDYEFTRASRPLPLGLLGVGSMLVDSFAVRILDQRMNRDFSRLLGEELRNKPLCVGLHVMGGPQIRTALTLSRRIKALTDAPVLWGGAFPSLVPEAVLSEESVDFAFCGEGEASFREFAVALREKRSVRSLQGLAYRDAGSVVQNDPPQRMDLNELPDLPYELLDVASYNWSAGDNRRKGLKLQIETSRGCTSGCIFCYNPYFYNRSWRAQNAERTLARMEVLIKGFGATALDIVDDSYFEDIPRVGDIARGMIRRGFGIRYLINGGKVAPILEMPDQDLELLKESGCETIQLGAESGSDRILEALAKGITSDQIRRSNTRLKRFEITPSYYFICGTPGERREDLAQSTRLMIDLLKDNPNAKIIAAFTFTPFARTPGYRLAREQGMPEPETLEAWSRFDTLNPLQPWLDAKQRRKMKVLFFLSMFIDGKINDISPSPLIRLAARLYRPIARWRLGRLRLSWAAEELVGRLVLAWLRRIQMRRAMSGDSDSLERGTDV